MNHQQPVVSLWVVAFLMLVLAGAPALVVAEASQKERGLEAVNPDTIIQLGGQGPDKKGLPIEVFLQRDLSIDNAAISPNGQYLATTGDSLILWDAKTGREIRRFLESDRQSKHTQYDKLVFDSKSRRIIAGSNLNSVRPYLDGKAGYTDTSTTIALYDIDSNTPIAIHSGNLGGVAALSVSPDDRYLFSGHYKTVAIWDLKTGQIIRTINCDGIVFAFSHNQQYALCAPSYNSILESSTTNIENSIHLIDIATGKELRRFIGHSQPITAANFNNDGSVLLSASRDGTLRIWNVATGNTTKVINVTQPKTEMMSSVGITINGVDSAILSPDGQYIIICYTTYTDSGDKSITDIFNRASDKKIQINYSVIPITFSRDGKHFFGKLPWLNDNGRSGVLVDTFTGAVVKSFRGNAQDNVHVLGFISTTHKALYATENNVFALDLDTGMASRLLSAGAQHLSGDGKVAVAVRGIKGKNPAGFKYLRDETDIAYEIKLYDSSTGIFIREIRASTNRKGLVWALGELWDEMPELKVVSVSDDAKYIVTISEDGVLSLWDSFTGREIRSIQHNEWRNERLNIACGLASGFVSSDGRTLLSIENTCNTYPVRQKDMVRIWAVNTGREIAAFPLEGRYPDTDFSSSKSFPVFAPDNLQFAVVTSPENLNVSANQSTISVYTKTGRKFSTTLKSSAYGVRIQWSSDSKIITLSTVDNVTLVDAVNGVIQKIMKPATGYHASHNMGDGKERAPYVSVSTDGKYAVDSRGVWDTATGKQLLFFAVLTNGEWLAITPEGFYSASERAHQFVSMRRGNQIYTADQLYDAFYRPDLVIDKLRGRDIQQAGGTTIEDALSNPPPSAEIVATTVQPPQGTTEIKYRIQGQGGGIGDVRLFHNQKPVRTVRVDAPGKEVREGTAVIQAVAGENEVSLIAYNRQNSVQGITQTASFQFDAPPKDPDLYIVGIGIGQYRLKDVNLPLAAKDVLDITKALSARMKSLYQPTKVHVELLADGLTEGGVTRERILNRLRELAGTLHPSDQLVVFIASHGLLWNGQYYVVTHDYDGRFGPDQGISASEIMDASRDIQALNQLFIFDTCHAGGVDQTLKAIYDARIRLFARRMGLHVYASAAPLQEALEGYQGRGLFAYALLEGLRHPKDVDQDGDGFVATTELGRYAKLVTQQVGQDIGFHQTPLIINVGQDKAIYRYPRDSLTHRGLGQLTRGQR